MNKILYVLMIVGFNLLLSKENNHNLTSQFFLSLNNKGKENNKIENNAIDEQNKKSEKGNNIFDELQLSLRDSKFIAFLNTLNSEELLKEFWEHVAYYKLMISLIDDDRTKEALEIAFNADLIFFTRIYRNAMRNALEHINSINK